MKTILKIAAVAIALVLMLLADVPNLPVPLLTVQLVPEAEAVLGVRRRTRRRSVAVGYTAGAAAASASASQQQAAPAQQQAAAPPPASAGQPLPLGTVVSALPGGCVSTAIGGVEYYECGANYYRSAFQGNNLVYVTAQP